ncbi:MAG TPA: hypothetical protein VGY48_12115 [Vicinamibacterales bacterium]|nr:hypothetical protein [Vicinamibacterales bacterium]
MQQDAETVALRCAERWGGVDKSAHISPAPSILDVAARFGLCGHDFGVGAHQAATGS